MLLKESQFSIFKCREKTSFKEKRGDLTAIKMKQKRL